ncbi:MAG: DNA recombination protein RmuC [Candidatus Korobacteraceae bacterium]
MPFNSVFLVIVGLALGVLLTWLFLRSSSAAISARLAITQQDLANTRAALHEQRQALAQAGIEKAGLESRLTAERKSSEEKQALLTQARDELRNAFNSLAADALKNNNEAFLQLAQQKFDGLQKQAAGDLEQRKIAVETLVAPLTEVLQRYDKNVSAMEQERQRAYGELSTTLKVVHEAQHTLRQETANLVAALRRPGVRSRWGEMTLRRVAELAGMSDRCDFTEQATIATENGSIRPDMLVHLPGDVVVPVDAKAPLDAYLDAVSASSDEDRKRSLARYATHVRGHMNTLAAKDYSGQFEITPAFTVLFLPGEPFFSAAAEQDTGLVEDAIQSKILIATPVTLVALLKAIAHGWRQEKLAESAQAVSLLGKELYERLMGFAQHLDGVGKSLDGAVESYNKAVGSLERRVMVSARRFRELGVQASDDLPEPRQIDRSARAVAAAFGQAPLTLATSEEAPEEQSLKE